MLEDSLFESQGRKKKRNPMTVVVSAIAHVVTVVVLVVVPLLQTQALTLPPVDMSLFLPKIESPKPIPVFAVRQHVQNQNHTPPDNGVFTSPPAIPKVIPLVDEPVRPDLNSLLPSGGTGTRSVLDIFGTRPTEAPVPSPPPPPRQPAPPPPPPVINAQPFRQGGKVQAANLIYQVKPVYPPLAKTTRTQGVVVLEAVINKDGSVESLRVVSGHQLLIQAALEAVKQWKYRPTMLNGEPIDVITTVTVTFTLQ